MSFIQINTKQNNTIRYDTIQYNTIQFKALLGKFAYSELKSKPINHAQNNKRIYVYEKQNKNNELIVQILFSYRTKGISKTSEINSSSLLSFPKYNKFASVDFEKSGL